MATPQQWNLSIDALCQRHQQITRLTLALIKGRTRARWRLTGLAEADLVLCDAAAGPVPDWPRVRRGRAQPMLLALVGPGGTASGHPRTLSTPLRVDALIRALDGVASELAGDRHAALPARAQATQRSKHRQGQPATAQPPTAHPQALADGACPQSPETSPAAAPDDHIVRLSPSTPLASALRTVTTARDAGAWRIDIGTTTLVVLPAEQTWFTPEPVALASIATLSRLEYDADARPVAPGDALLIAAPARRQPLHQLLWSCGLAAPSDRLLPWLAEGARLRLRAWPAVLRGHAVPAHTGFAALLLQDAHTVAELAAQTGRNAAEVRGFVNACALCGLIDAGPGPDPMPARRGRKGPAAKVLWHGARRTRRTPLGQTSLAKSGLQPLAAQPLSGHAPALPASRLRLGAIGPLADRAAGRA